MKIITFEDICKLQISPVQCYEWVSEMILNKGNVLLPPKISMKPEEGIFCNVMPSIITNSQSNEKFGGVKVVTRYPERSPSLDSQVVLFNAVTGQFLALMDSNWITTMRTGAVAAHSILLLAKENFSEIGIVGLGNTTRATILVLASLMPEKKFHIKLLKYKGQEELFANRFSEFSNLSFSYVDTPKELVSGSDVIISGATYLPNNLCEDKYFEKGVLVVPIHTLGFTNCDLFFDKIYGDDLGHIEHFKYFNKFKHFAEVSEVVNKRAIGRESNDERIIAYNIGVSMHDINFANHIYELLENSDCIEVDLKSPQNKFWI